MAYENKTYKKIFTTSRLFGSRGSSLQEVQGVLSVKTIEFCLCRHSKVFFVVSLLVQHLELNKTCIFRSDYQNIITTVGKNKMTEKTVKKIIYLGVVKFGCKIWIKSM
jgi:hypothetical protein